MNKNDRNVQNGETDPGVVADRNLTERVIEALERSYKLYPTDESLELHFSNVSVYDRQCANRLALDSNQIC